MLKEYRTNLQRPAEVLHFVFALGIKKVSVKTLAEHKPRNKYFSDHTQQVIKSLTNRSGESQNKWAPAAFNKFFF